MACTLTPLVRASSTSLTISFIRLPAALVGDLDVQDLDLDAGPSADLDDFADGIEDAGPLAADVGNEDPLVTGHDLAELDDFVGPGQESRSGVWARAARQAGGALLHGLCDELLHLLELGRSGPGMRGAHHALPDVAEADERGDVDRDAGLLRLIEVFAQRRGPNRLPADPDAHGIELADARAGRFAFAEDLGGDPLANLALGPAVLLRIEYSEWLGGCR